tara:strand:- start:1255 stop:1425 length:171 start_codon:yes stop_codon:yes gene_type:complete
MTWTGVECKVCNCETDIGLYYSDYHDDDLILNIEMTCGECVRELKAARKISKLDYE